jgi:hypothetical protein
MRGLIELTGFGDLLRLVGILFWVLVVGALIMALTLPKTRKDKAFAVLVVVGLFIAFPGRWALEAKQRNTLPDLGATANRPCPRQRSQRQRHENRRQQTLADLGDGCCHSVGDGREDEQSAYYR